MDNNGNAATRRSALLASGVGNFMEYYDWSLYGFFATTLGQLFFPKANPTAALLSTFAIFALGFFARPVGGIVFGHIGDRIGRRPAFILSLILMSSGTVAIGLLPTHAQIGTLAPILLLLCRLLQGFSVGGEYSSSTIYVIEHAPRGMRGRYASLSGVVSCVTYVVGSLLALVITTTTTSEQLMSWGWRVPFLIAAPIAVVGLYIRLQVDESPAFEAIRKEKRVEAAPIVEALRVARKPMLVLFGMNVSNAVGFYLVTAFLVSYLNTSAKFSKTDTLLLVFVAMFIEAVGSFLAGYLIDKVGRKPVAVGSALCAGIWAIPAFLLLRHPSMLDAFIAIGVFMIFLSGIAISCALAFVELFPARVRSSASALAYQASYTLFGGTIPYLATWLVAGGHFLGPGYYLAGLCAVSTFAAAAGIGNRTPAVDDSTALPAQKEGAQQASA